MNTCRDSEKTWKFWTLSAYLALCISFIGLFVSVSLYPPDYANCLAVSHCSLNPGKTRHEQGSWKKMRGALGTVNVRAKSFQSCLTLWDPMDCSPPGSSVHGVFQQENLSGLPFPPQRAFPDPGIKPTSPALRVDSLPLSHLGRNCRHFTHCGKADMLYSPMAGTAVATTQPNSIQFLLPSKGFSGGAYITLQNKKRPVGREYIMTCMRSSISDLSCYITMQSHYLQNMGWQQKVAGQESLTTAILANL